MNAEEFYKILTLLTSHQFKGKAIDDGKTVEFRPRVVYPPKK